MLEKVFTHAKLKPERIRSLGLDRWLATCSSSLLVITAKNLACMMCKCSEDGLKIYPQCLRAAANYAAAESRSRRKCSYGRNRSRKLPTLMNRIKRCLWPNGLGIDAWLKIAGVRAWIRLLGDYRLYFTAGVKEVSCAWTQSHEQGVYCHLEVCELIHTDVRAWFYQAQTISYRLSVQYQR